MEYTVIAIIYADGTTQYIAIGGNGQPLDPQPDLSNAVPCPVDTTGDGAQCCPDYSTATLQSAGNATLTQIEADIVNLQTELQAVNTSLSTIIALLVGQAPQVQYKTVQGIVGTGGNLANPFVLPANCVSVQVIPLAVNPTNLALFTTAQLLGNTVKDDYSNTVTLAVLSSWKVERRQLANGAYQPVGGNIEVAATTGGSVFIIYETT